MSQPALHPPSSSPSFAPPTPEPMLIDTFNWSNTEHQQIFFNRLCLYCWAEGHPMPVCPVSPPCSAVSTIQLPPITPLTRTDINVMTPCHSVAVKALIDLGSAGNLLCKLHLQKITCSEALNIHSIQGKTSGLWLHSTLHPHFDAPHRMPPSGTDFIHDGGGYHC